MKLSGIHYFVLGLIASLILFEKLRLTITYTVQGSASEWITALGTLGAVIVALAIAIFGKSIGEWFYKSDIKVIESLENTQLNRNSQITSGHTRLFVENKGRATAEEVEIYVNNIWHNGHARRGYLPVPLYWTHNGSKRDFHPKQYGYLDLCRRDNVNDNNSTPRLVLFAGGGVPAYEDLDRGKTELELVIFQKSGQLKKYKVNLEWRLPLPYTEVTKIQDIS